MRLGLLLKKWSRPICLVGSYTGLAMHVGPQMFGEDQWQKGINLIANKSTLDEGYEFLFKPTRQLLICYLRGSETPRSDHEDIISVVLAKIWEQRDTLSFTNPAAWLAYVHTCAKNRRLDFRLSAHERHTSTQEVPEETENESSQAFREELEKHLEYQSLLRVADDHWLGAQPPHFRSRLLAATLLLWDRRRLSVIVHALKRLGEIPPDAEPKQVADWINHDTVLRTFAYVRAHVPPEQLFATLTEGEELDPQHEGVILWWRFAQFNPRHRILDRLPAERHEQAETLLTRYESRLPFASSFDRIMNSFNRINRPILAESGVWKRLIFQYKLYALPHDDMLQWFGPSANQAGFPMDDVTLHGWLSNHRLKGELQRAYQGQNG